MSKTFYKVLSAILALILIAATVCTIVFWQLGNIQFYPIGSEDEVDEVDEEVGGMVVDEGDSSSAITLSMTKLSVDEYEEYGVSLLAETAYTITVKPVPSDAVDTYTWTCTNTSQISLSPSSDTNSCVVSCSGAFGTQATITVTSDVDSDVYAEITVDYVKRLSSVSFALSADSISFSSTATSYTITATPVWGTGTITPDFEITGGSLATNVYGTYSSSNTVTNSDGSQTVYTRTLTLTDYSFSGDTFSISTPTDTFVSGSTTSETTRTYLSYSDIDTYALQVTTYPTESSVITLYNNSFATNVTGTTSDGTLTINYTISYTPSGSVAGSYSDSGSSSIGVAFDVSALASYAADLTPDYEGIVF